MLGLDSLQVSYYLGPLAACVVISATSQAIMDKLADNHRIRDTGTVQSLSLIGGIYASCIATLIFVDSSSSRQFENLLRWEVLFCLFLVNFFLVVNIPAEGESDSTTGFEAFFLSHFGSCARSGVVAMNVVVLRSAFPAESYSATFPLAKLGIGHQIVLLVLVGSATFLLSMIGNLVFQRLNAWRGQGRAYNDRPDRNS